jgi:hypothetical protein
MPGGINDPGLGSATFCAIKFAGYTAAAHFRSIRYDGVDHVAWKVGASLRVNGSRERAPDDRLREAIQSRVKSWIASSLCSSQ